MGQETKQRRFSKEFREEAVRRLGETANVSELCREPGISRQLLYWWRERVEEERRGRFLAVEQRLRQENAQLKKAAGEEDAGSGFFEGCLRKGRGSTPDRYRFWRNGIRETIRELMPIEGSLGIEPMCRLAAPAAPDSMFSSNATPAKKAWKCAA